MTVRHHGAASRRNPYFAQWASTAETLGVDVPCGYGAKHEYEHSPSFTHVGERSPSFASASLCFISLCYYVPSTSSRDGMNKASRRRIDENRPKMFQSLKLQSK